MAATLAGIPLGVTKLSSFDLNLANKFRDFGEVSLFKLDIAGLFEGKSVTEAVFIIIMLVLSFSLVNMFDSMGTLMGAGKQSGLVDENGEVIHMQEALMADAISTAAGALMGTSTAVSYTHLDVYKRQELCCRSCPIFSSRPLFRLKA